MGCNVLIDNSEFIINHYDRNVMLRKMKSHLYHKYILYEHKDTTNNKICGNLILCTHL